MAHTRYDRENYMADNYGNPDGYGQRLANWGRGLFNKAKTKGLDAFSRAAGAARGGGFRGDGEEDSPFVMEPSNSDRAASMFSNARNRGSELFTNARDRGKGAYDSGLNKFSDAWAKAQGLFERDADEPGEDRSQWTETRQKMEEEKDKEKTYQIDKIRRRFNSKIKYEKDPLERKRLEIERDAKIRQIDGKGMSAAERFMLGKGGDFMAGVNSTSDSDVIQPGYKSFDVDSSPDEIARARTYNKRLQDLSGKWSKPAAAIGKGLGAFASASMGGIPGLLAGTAISKGIPMAADWLMNRSAGKHEEEDAMERKYNPNRL